MRALQLQRGGCSYANKGSCINYGTFASDEESEKRAQRKPRRGEKCVCGLPRAYLSACSITINLISALYCEKKAVHASGKSASLIKRTEQKSRARCLSKILDFSDTDLVRICHTPCA